MYLTDFILIMTTPEHICDLCKMNFDQPLFKIGESCGDPIHGHSKCLPIILIKLETILRKAFPIKTGFVSVLDMVSSESFITKLIDPREEMRLPEVRSKIMKFFSNKKAFMTLLSDLNPTFIEENSSIINTLVSWDCLYPVN